MDRQHLLHLAGAVSDLLGTPTRGAVAFLRCLSSNQIDSLAESPDFVIPGWNVSAVVDRSGFRRITADQAVELRESKDDPVLLLIDPLRAGAGLDGIYSAGREISEAELFDRAQERARKILRGRLRFLDLAVRRAARIGNRRRLSPWSKFDFYVAVLTEGDGKAISRLGLWPVDCQGSPDEGELDLAAGMSARLLYIQDTRSVGERIRSLQLENASTIAPGFERFLRKLSDRSPEEAAIAIAAAPEYWLGPLRPRFSADVLQVIKLTSWRDSRGAVLKWSGLTAVDGDSIKPRMLLDREAAVRERSRLTVRWTTSPESLAAGSVEYRVAVIAGEELLADVTLAHRDKPSQQAVFSVEDFEELEGNEKFEAVAEITAIGSEAVAPVRTEEFVLEFGQSTEKASSGSGQVFRTLVDGAISLASRSSFDDAISPSASGKRASEDKKGFITWKGEAGTRAVRVMRPALIRHVEEDWATRSGPIGRWVQPVRTDGSPAGAPQFLPIDQGDCEAAVWDRVKDASRKLSSELNPFGLIARVRSGRWPAEDSYINGWAAALESGNPEAALHGTVEVQTLSGRTLGLIVTPLHPLRFAWQGMYDRVASHARYEEGLSALAVQKALTRVDSTHFPFALPGTGNVRAFVFADVLGFHAVAMTVDDESEPKAAVALMSACLGAATGSTAPSIGVETASVLAREVKHFLSCHLGSSGSPPELLNIQAWRPGDGMTVARALGQALSAEGARDNEDEAASPLCFTLDLYHPPSSGASGQFLSTVGRRRRSGGGILEAVDRWMTETAPRPGGVLVPRLRWSKHIEPASPGDADAWKNVRASHLGLVFDVFDTSLEVRPIAELARQRPMHVYGLARSMERRVNLGDDPEWTAFTAPELTGDSAPENRTSGDRLRRIDRAISRATARAIGGGPTDWPVLVTRLPFAGRNRIERLHERCDWVITIDRNAGLEYFDAPKQFSDVYERFVIDAVPERGDLGTLQLVTSTANLGAVRDLVDQALDEMGLSSSERNSRFLIDQLKGLSGRLAIRLANAPNQTAELIALALVQANCVQSGTADGPWLDLTQGFLIPVDEIAGFAPLGGNDIGFIDNGCRADFFHVRAPGRGSLEFRFVEVKHRLHLRTARQQELLTHMLEQTTGLRARWMSWFFGTKLTQLERSARRWQLSRMLVFYADRARRHRLGEKEHARILFEIDQLLLKDGYQPAELTNPDIGYVFCPEHRTGSVEELYAVGGEDARFFLFGPAFLPDEQMSQGATESYAKATVFAADSVVEPNVAEDSLRETFVGVDQTDQPEEASRSQAVGESAQPVDVVLGETVSEGVPVEWSVSIKSNPHLMMVGLPGMGKTTALINICEQLAKAGIPPIVFSYHDDIDAKLTDALGLMRTVDVDQLGFDPLRIDRDSANAHVDVSGELRDVFASIFPDLGDIQLEELRQAIKKSYDDLGWSTEVGSAHDRQTPKFRSFFDILKAKQKPNANLLARLQELYDYGFFDGIGEKGSPLDINQPTLVRIHATSNTMLQNAFSSFVLYSLYKDMFRRGRQERITHAIIVDEAHRAAKLKLLPRMAKECRKYGLCLALASQGARDFDSSLYEAVGSYLVLRVTEADARVLARNTGASTDQQRTADRLKGLPPYSALFFSTNTQRPIAVKLQSISSFCTSERGKEHRSICIDVRITRSLKAHAKPVIDRTYVRS